MKTRVPRIYLERLGGDYPGRIEEGLEQVGFFQIIEPGSRVFLKPNLTFPSYRPGVMTSPECLEAVTQLLVKRGYSVLIGEADSGGYNRFSMDEVFQKMGIRELAERTGAKIVNMSYTEPSIVEGRHRGRRLRIGDPTASYLMLHRSRPNWSPECSSQPKELAHPARKVDAGGCSLIAGMEGMLLILP